MSVSAAGHEMRFGLRAQVQSAFGLATGSSDFIIRDAISARRECPSSRSEFVARFDAGVAQLVEHNVANVVVVGSNPITRSIIFKWVKHEE